MAKSKVEAAIVILLALIGILVALYSQHAMSDDAYISMRIARNALEGRGLHFNAGETGVQAATSPLNLLALLGIGAIGLVFGASAEGAIQMAPFIILMFALPVLMNGTVRLTSGSDRYSFFGVLAAIAMAFSPLVIATIGLETVLLMALLTWSLIAFANERWTLCGAFLGLSMLARHDAGILALIVLFAISRRRDKSLMSALLPMVIIVGPWLIFSALYFGATVPTTLQAKMAQGGTAYWPGAYYAQFWKWLVAVFWGQQAVAIGTCALAFVGIGYAWKGRSDAHARALLFLVAYMILHVAAYSLMRLPDYHWYFVPYAISLTIAAAYGLHRVYHAPAEAGAAAALVGIGAAFVSGFSGPPVDERLRPYQEVALYLSQHPPKTAVGLMEIGMVGFYAPNIKVYDFGGIVTPEQRDLIRTNNATGWLEDPSVADQVVVRCDPHQFLEPFADPRFQNLYELEWTSPSSKLFPNGLQVWRLKN